MNIEGKADAFFAGAVGEPGRRVFFLYVEVNGEPMWFKAEKEQIAALGSQSLEALSQAELEVDDSEVEEILEAGTEVPEPTRPDQIRFAVREMALGVDLTDEMATLFLAGDDGATASFTVTAAQLRATALAALASVQAGRPICPRCQLPEEPEGHDCPSSNGHKRLV